MGKNGKRKLPEPLTAEEQEGLISQVNAKTDTGLRNRAMLAAMLGAGLRVSEVVTLRPSEVDFSKGEIRVNNGKGGDRVIPVDGETLGWLRAWDLRRQEKGFKKRGALFPRLRSRGYTGQDFSGGEIKLNPGEPMTTRNVQEIVKRLAVRADIDRRVAPHELRHTYASDMLAKGFTVVEIQALLGHRHLSTTLGYLHVDQKALREKVQKKSVFSEKVAALEAELEELKALMEVEN